MDFVTAVSHELRTPLTIIGSAADNIASGVVDTREQLKEYGTVIGHEVGQLSGLVERILLFASTRDGRQKYVLEPLSPADIVDGVLTGTGGLIRAAQFTVERDVAAEPAAGRSATAIAVSQCLENLVTNALKYGQEKRWIRLRAALVPDAGGEADAVEISVSDGGMGIDADDLPHIFDPFYRSRSAQIGADSRHRARSCRGEADCRQPWRLAHGDQRRRSRQHVHAAAPLLRPARVRVVC